MERGGDDRVVISVIVRIAAVAKNFEVFSFWWSTGARSVTQLCFTYNSCTYIYSLKIYVHRLTPNKQFSLFYPTHLSNRVNNFQLLVTCPFASSLRFSSSFACAFCKKSFFRLALPCFTSLFFVWLLYFLCCFMYFPSFLFSSKFHLML